MSKRHPFWGSFFGNLAASAAKAAAKAAIAATRRPLPGPLHNHKVARLDELAAIEDGFIDDEGRIPIHPLDVYDKETLQRSIYACTPAQLQEALKKLRWRHKIRVTEIIMPVVVSELVACVEAQTALDEDLAASKPEVEQLKAKIADPNTLPGERGIAELLLNQHSRRLHARIQNTEHAFAMYNHAVEVARQKHGDNQ